MFTEDSSRSVTKTSGPEAVAACERTRLRFPGIPRPTVEVILASEEVLIIIQAGARDRLLGVHLLWGAFYNRG